MSSLGDTVQSGETGTVTKLQHMPDQLPDNPGTLVANTSIETLQNIMYQNWVWRNTFTIDPSMLPGHVFGVIKIHPQNCNDYITHISKMFLTWNGAFKIRSRFMATFQFGGSFRVGFLPPKFTEQQVQNLPIQTLTAYPNVDLDPKNTGWSEFQASDERNVLFHWMSDLSNEDPQSFAGWFVFYVAAPLVVSGTINNVSMLIEAAGNFEFAQLTSIANIGPTSKSWLSNSLSNLDVQTGCDDRLITDSIYVAPVSIVSAPDGFIYAKAPGNILPETATAGAVVDPVRLSVQRNGEVVTSILCKIEAKDASLSEQTYDMTNFNNYYLPTNTNFSVQVYEDVLYPLGAKTFANATIKKFDATAWPDPKTRFNHLFLSEVSGGTATTQDDGFMWLSDIVTSAFPRTPKIATEIKIVNDTTKMPNLIPTESMVFFTNTKFGSINAQTLAQTLELEQVPKPDSETSQIYQLFRSDHPTAVLTMRLLPNGMWTTRATDVEALLTPPNNTHFYLRYLQDLPITSPLPPSHVEPRTLRAAARYARNPSENAKKTMWSGF